MKQISSGTLNCTFRFQLSYFMILVANSFGRLLKRVQRRGLRKIDEPRRTLQYVDARRFERNEAYESFSAAS
jgi:hypothetical protein